MSYAQGFMLLREAAKQYNWKLNYGGIALMWRGGCIIRRLVLFIKYRYGHFGKYSNVMINIVLCDKWFSGLVTQGLSLSIKCQVV